LQNGNVFLAQWSFLMSTSKANPIQSPAMAPEEIGNAAINATTVAANSTKGGTMTFQGTPGADVFNGGRGTNIYIGGPGADVMGSTAGRDIFVYQSVEDSPLVARGGVIDRSADDWLFTGHAPTIDLSAFHLNGIVVSKNNSGSTANLDNGIGFFGTASVVEHQSASGYPKMTWWRAWIDTNHDGNLDIGDMMIQGSSISKGPAFIF
jgi:hypothetical protein